MSLKTTIDADIKKAMLAKEKDKLRALRAIKAAILLAETEKGAKEEISGEKELAILMKMAKQRKDSATIYTEQKREDLAKTELDELQYIELYLPTMMSEEEVKQALVKIKTDLNITEASDMGKLMGAAMKELTGKADGKLISSIAKEILA